MFRELMQTAGLEIWAEIGLVAFCIAFGAVIAYVVHMTPKDANAAARIPLEDEEVTR
jgi:cbb3-type cytochrome oxidase subunit 3